MAKIYTRKGDRGETSFFDGSRTSKADPRVELYGDLDELSSILGIAICHLEGSGALGAAAAGEAGSAPPVAEAAGPKAGLAGSAGEPSTAPRTMTELAVWLADLQRQLFELSAILAHPGRSRELAAAGPEALPVSALPLERQIDAMTEDLPPLRNFILPGGEFAAAHVHHARTVCRRAERRAVALAGHDAVPAGVIVYLNRLSDFLFVAARWVNHLGGRRDVIWPGR